MEEARQYVDQAKALFPGGILITLNEAIVLKREGRLEEAVQLLKTEKYPQDPMTRLKVKHELGLMYDRLDNVDKAFEQFRDFNACASEVFGISRQRKAPYLNKIERFREVLRPNGFLMEKAKFRKACKKYGLPDGVYAQRNDFVAAYIKRPPCHLCLRRNSCFPHR